MEKMIAFCGLDCAQCGAYIATRDNDDAKRAEVAAEWSKEFNADIKPQDINCDGCTSTGERVFSHCNVCEIRRCGLEKGVANCATCAEFACQRIQGFMDNVPVAKQNLEEIRRAV